MAIGTVALDTQHRRACFQQVVDRRSVWLVADTAVLAHWFVVVHKRPALFHVAGEASFIGARLGELLWIVAMHVVA